MASSSQEPQQQLSRERWVSCCLIKNPLPQLDGFDYDIQSLTSTLPVKRGVKDDYRSGLVPSFPLSCSQVIEGGNSSLCAPILELPDEIVAIILENIDQESLSSLALVDRGFRQLARSRQFSSVLFDYSPAKWDLLNHLAKEGEKRVAHESVTSLSIPSIGICIRRFRVDTRGKWFNSVNKLEDTRVMERPKAGEGPSEAERKAKLDAAKELYLKALRTLSFVFAHALPNLQLVDWEDKVGLPTSLHQDLLGSKISHLKLNRIRVIKDSPVDFEDTVKSTTIRTLYLDIQQQQLLSNHISRTANFAFASSLLRLCAPTLEILDWNALFWRGTGWTLTKPGASMPIFTKLHCLDIRNIGFLDDISLKCFLQAPLSRLAMNVANGSAVNLLSQRGCIQTLKTLLCIRPWPQTENDNVLGFLANNPRLAKLSLHVPNHTPSLDERILRLLSTNFTSLSSLSVRWNSNSDLEDSILIQLAQIQSLEQLHIRLNNEDHPYDLWPINHSRMREALYSLPSLKRIAFSSDSYPITTSDLADIDRYYEAQALQDEVSAAMFEDDPEFENIGPEDAKEILWRRQHEKAMLREAKKYVEVMPKLEWIYFGQLGMEIHKNWKGQRCVRVVEGRNNFPSNYKFLRETFEWEGVTEYAN